MYQITRVSGVPAVKSVSMISRSAIFKTYVAVKLKRNSVRSQRTAMCS